MAAFLAYESALAVLRSHAATSGTPMRHARVFRLPDTSREVSSSLGGCPPEATFSGRLHVLVSSPQSRSKRASCTSHVWSQPLVTGSFVNLGDDVYVSTPEFLFLQMASTSSLPQLVMLGYELCGTYTLTDRYGRGFITDIVPITTPSKISQYLARSPGRKGVDKAKAALRWIRAHSNSPMETALAMLLTLPRQDGGQHLSPIVLNPEFPLNLEWRRRLGRQSFKPDIYFPKQRIAVEYYGKEDHTSISSKQYDATRQALMEYLGIRVLGVTSEELYHPDKYIGMLKELYRLLGKKYRMPSDDQQVSTLLLKDEILPGHDSTRYLYSINRKHRSTPCISPKPRVARKTAGDEKTES